MQRFVTGLSVSISRQLLFSGQPRALEEAIKEAIRIEYALSFEAKPDSVTNPHGVTAIDLQSTEKPDDYRHTLELLTKRLETLESKLQATAARNDSKGTRQQRRITRRPRYEERTCWNCGEGGHLQRNCPHLNYRGPTRPVEGWPRE